jgi:hypothetical protein
MRRKERDREEVSDKANGGLSAILSETFRYFTRNFRCNATQTTASYMGVGVGVVKYTQCAHRYNGHYDLPLSIVVLEHSYCMLDWVDRVSNSHCSSVHAQHVLQCRLYQH